MQHRPPVLWALAAVALGACAISKQVPEMVGLPEETADAGSQPTADAGSATSKDAATSGNEGGAVAAGAGGSADMAKPSDDTGAGGAGARAPAPDAGAPPASDAATATDASRPIDDTACAFELAECLLLDPLNYEECLRKNMERCGLVADDASLPAAPSPACSMQTAECIARMPDKAQECLDMQETCRL